MTAVALLATASRAHFAALLGLNCSSQLSIFTGCPSWQVLVIAAAAALAPAGSAGASWPWGFVWFVITWITTGFPPHPLAPAPLELSLLELPQAATDAATIASSAAKRLTFFAEANRRLRAICTLHFVVVKPGCPGGGCFSRA